MDFGFDDQVNLSLADSLHSPKRFSNWLELTRQPFVCTRTTTKQQEMKTHVSTPIHRWRSISLLSKQDYRL